MGICPQVPLLWALLGTNFRFWSCQEHVSELVLPFFASVGPLCTNKCSDTLWAHSGPRGGKTRVSGWLFFGVPGQEVQGGEPPPCPRVALSPDLAVAFHKNGYLPPSAPVVGTIGDKFQVLIIPGTCVWTSFTIFHLCGPTVPSELNEQERNLMVFDDCILEKQNKAQSYYTRGRHSWRDSFHISQNYFKLDRQTIRENIDLVILFPQNPKSLVHIHADHCVELSFKDFCNHIWSEKCNFVTLDLTNTERP